MEMVKDSMESITCVGLFLLTMLVGAILSEEPFQTNEQLVQTVYHAVNNPVDPITQYQTLQAVSELIIRGNETVKQPEVIDWLVVSGANCLDNNANWVDGIQGRKIYDILKRIEGDLVIDSLCQQILNPEIRLRVIFLGVKLGIEGSEQRLNQVLLDHGDKEMAEDFLNSGSTKLYEGGAKWAKKNSYQVMPFGGRARVAWGEF